MDKTDFPDFYMTSTESYALGRKRKCYRVKRIHADGRDDYLLIRIDPPLDGRRYGIDNDQVSELIIAARHKGISLFPIRAWPVSVYVLYALILHPESYDTLKDDELTLIDWAEIYLSEENIPTM